MPGSALTRSLPRLRREQRGQRALRHLELRLARLGRRERALERGARAGERARAERVGVPLAPGEQLEREADRRQRAERADRAAPACAARARRCPAAPAAPSSSGATRCEPQRSCSFGRRRGLDAALVAGHRLVLGAVVAHEVAAAQRHERRDDADHASRRARRGSRRGGARRRPARCTRPRRPRRCRARTRAAPRAGCGGSRAARRTSRTCARRRARAARRRPTRMRGRAPLATRMLAVGGAHGRRPRGRAEQRQAVAQGDSAEAELLVAHAVTDPIRSMQCTNARTASSRSRTSMRSSGA